MVSARRAAGLLTTVTLAAALLAGCGDDEPGTADPSGDPSSSTWTAATDPLDPGGLGWASGSEVHLGDGTTIDTGEKIEEYVVAGDDVFLTTGEQVEGDTAAITASPLYAAGRDGEAREVAPGVASPLASPDGRYLVFLDVVTGEQDRFGTAQAEIVVVDLEQGTETRTTDGMGDPAEDDFTDNYNDAEIGVERVTDDTAYVGALDGDYAVDLASGDAEKLDPADRSWDRRAGDPTSPDGRWRIVDTDDLRDTLRSQDGDRVVPDPGTPRWDLDHWTADGLAVGFAISGPVTGDGSKITGANGFALMGCTVPAGKCTVVPETTGGTILFPAGQADFASTTLPAGR
ncbi:hypothetical protein H5V45_13195 [Nocardioides sp. KIGAM211]|uniref:Uncharacterized protein n=1 Tax=Nocardioides luti TaxID=2761101 RepID=A0A7X0RHH6_9ACTN|nr:hypothetical protein [Nocardioides luti]MBB6628277.1 hypothetical protein [Nocardioides luti]